MTNLEEIKKSFKDKKLFDMALTHRSWVNENRGQRGHNERLEFLGDAVLEFVVSEELFKRFPDQEEGYLTALRANLVNTKNLSQIGKKLSVGDAIFLSKGEELGGGRQNSTLLANTVEAIIGSIYEGQGLDAAASFIKENLLIDLTQKINEPLKDPKSRLQEMVQSQGLSAPRYKVVKIEGPDHAREFTVEVKIGKEAVANAKGKSKAEGEQKAASIALEKLSPKK